MFMARLATLLLLAAGAAAHAADNGVYVGGALSRSSIDTDSEFFGFSFKDEDTAYKLIAGVRPFDRLALEANYVNFGSLEFSDGQVADSLRGEYEGKALDAFAVVFVGGPFIEGFGKIGAVYWDTERVLQGGIGGIDLRDDDSGADLAWGAGAQAYLGSLAVRLEYERFEVDSADRLDLWSLGVTYTFL